MKVYRNSEVRNGIVVIKVKTDNWRLEVLEALRRHKMQIRNHL